ncbi:MULTISPECIES: sulfite exporter TauE/SafE family protein [Aeromonas]|uniref:Probable membrane transporter protein n=2 Tax=Aeromonas caviae TaxID=648 RepID=A0A2K0LUK6_AERCA|nr:MULTISPECIES: sulfite exporter TauE/SafE family protein [Aeromonas]PZR01632.1 MAG: sulfite exporter TauE/SafE family protein [Aeromonas media]AUV18607.1 sulfite exporter TauE/SafE family protein [Aeromonas sp. ASNIH7]AUZ81496.1 sulfite exporter TauE/SafE family protein [Aeromonas sp. ASNIH1]KEP91554.1 membrane protein [Aeromonas caviae]KMY35617.1 membrane protein [Aeromonas caviae]
MLFVGYLVLGAFAGMLAGLFGIGGGLIIVPVLVLSFHAQGVAPEIITHLALGTSLPTMIFTGFSSLRAHQEAGAVDWGMIRRLGAGMLVGAWLGGMTANLLSASTLNIIIGCFAWTMALQMGLNLRPKAERHMPGPLGTGIAGTVIGWMSALFGIGGGSLTVPYLTWNSVPMRNAVAASAACSMPIALAGSLSYLYAGWGDADLPEWSVGFIYLPALLGIVLTSTQFARLGARLAHSMSPRRLKQAFALLMLLVGAKFMLFS